VIADVLGKHGAFEFLLVTLVRCPLCHGPVTEKTLVDRVGGPAVSASARPEVP
jgi:hypothetical protein